MLLGAAKIEHRVRMMSQEFLRAVGGFLVNLQLFGIDQLAFVDAFDKFHQRGHGHVLA